MSRGKVHEGTKQRAWEATFVGVQALVFAVAKIFTDHVDQCGRALKHCCLIQRFEFE